MDMVDCERGNRENGEDVTTIYDLNDDCLECIFERIQDLPTQIQISKCCQRFQSVIQNLWKRQSHHRVLAFNMLPTILQNYDDFGHYLRALRTEFDTLLIIDDCLNVFLKEMEECGIESLPAVEKCEFHDDVTECYPNDDDIESLSRLVPNLKYLQITVPISGRNLTKFHNLEELHLYDEQTKSIEMDENAFRDVLLNLKNLRVLDIRNYECSQLKLSSAILKCTKLEVLKLNLNTLKPGLDYVLKMPHLKQLKVLLDQEIDVSQIENVDTHDYMIYETEEYYHILREKGSHILGLAVDFHFLPVSSTWFKDFRLLNPENLRLLALSNYEFTADEYENCCFPHLEMLCLRHSEKLHAVTVLEMLHLCPVLKHLDLCYCLNLDKSLLNGLTIFLQNQKRSHALCVYYRMSGLEKEIEENSTFWTSQKYLKLLNDIPPDSDIGLSYVQRGFAFYF
ncbi:uncharacterized protein LOC106089778 [Stomoxys calcitrans]|uniref:uncharacterized protein LOC106089778 n=1 Tax=Stomoxys calcitrans TaxID=35570 RepID=UPI0027E34B37|nr:uncharacterized protein LOC106089778 [Stomoxys calcitrans]